MNDGTVIIKDARTLGMGKMMILGLQHMFAMFGATILVPILVNGYFHGSGLSVQVTLLCAGLGTLGFHFITGFKVPAFLGSSFAFLGGFATIAELNTGIYKDMSYADKLPYACGGIVVAGLLYIVLAIIVKLVGVRRVMRYLPPIVTGPIIICIGLSLYPSTLANITTNVPLAIVAALTVILFYVKGKGMFKILPILMGVVISYIVAIIMQSLGVTNSDGSDIINTAALASSAWVGLPPLQMVKFDPTAIMVMSPISIATMMEHVGDMVAISATTGENYIEDPGLHRTLVGDGLMTAFAGAIGGPANTTYGENTGVLELSKVHDPRVIRIAAIVATVLGFTPKVANIFGTMPAGIVGGISFILYGMIAGIGVRNLVENKVDFTNSRNLIIFGLITGAALVFSAGITFTVAGTSITLTGLALAAIVGIITNAILPNEDYEFNEDDKGAKHRGIHIG